MTSVRRFRVGAAAGAFAMTGALLAAAPSSAVSAGLAAGAASTPAAAANYCSISAGAIDGAGTAQQTTLTASTPPSATSSPYGAAGFYSGKSPRLLTSEYADGGVADVEYDSYGVIGDGLHFIYSAVDGTGTVENSGFVRIGGGWSGMRAIERSVYDLGSSAPPGSAHRNFYALGSDGTISRWSYTGSSTRFGTKQSAGGFSSVKTMALIGQTSSYDTFLVNTFGGALYTVRLPLGSPLKPVVTKVRTSGWSSFTSLMAENCGKYGVLLLGVTATGAGQLYAVGHAAGASTVIQSIGAAPSALTGSAVHRVTGMPFYGPPLHGD